MSSKGLAVVVPGLLALSGLFALAAPAAAAVEWKSEGPARGTVFDVAFDPSNPSTVYAVNWNGGVWRSDDGGATWSLPSTEMVSRGIQWIEVDRAKPSTIWAGEKVSGEPALWRSLDRGATWKTVQDPAKPTSVRMQPVGYRIAFAPTRPTDIWVPSTSLHYRSRDGGKTWTDFRIPGQDAYAMAVDPRNPDVIYSAGHGGDSFHFSRSEDNGKSWKATGTGLGAGIRSLVVDDASTLYAFGSGTEIWKSTDRGETWSEIASPVSGTDDIWRFQVDPSNREVLWASTESGLKRSDDGGRSWAESDSWSGGYLVRSVAFDPRDARKMIAGVAGTGIFRSGDGGGSWETANGGFSGAWIDDFDGSPRNSTLYVKTSTGRFRRDAPGTWSEMGSPFSQTGGDVDVHLAFDRQTPRGMWAFEGANLWRSPNDGLRWDLVKLPELKMRDMMKGRTSVVSFGSFVQDPGNPQTIYGGSWSSTEPGFAISKSVDAGKSWKPAATGLPGEEVDELLSEAPNVIFARVGDGELYRTDDGGASWKSLPGFPAGRLRRLLVDPSLPARLYALTDDDLFRSTDSGASWTKLEGAIGKEDVEAIVVSPAGDLYAGHFHGISKSSDAGATWKAVGDGLINTDVRALAIFGAPARLAAGTAGNGVFTTDLP